MMRLPVAAVAAFLLGLGNVLQAAPQLSLEQAFEMALAQHPLVDASRLQTEQFQAQRELAGMGPPLAVAAELENALGTGSAAALRGAEVTVSLSSAIEREEKRLARVAVAEGQLQAVKTKLDAQVLDIHAQTARRYLAALSAQAELAIAQRALEQTRQLLAVSEQRSQRGASPMSTSLAAQAAVARAEGEVLGWEQALTNAKRRLAVLWGDPLAAFELPELALRLPDSMPDYRDLSQLLARNPELEQFADAERVREAQLRLRHSEGLADWQWQLGLRRLQAEDDWGLVAGVSVPLGARQRAAPGIREAQAALTEVDAQRAVARRELEATLVDAWGELQAAAQALTHIQQRLLPALAAATASAREYYQAGAGDLLAWQRLQIDQVGAEREQLHALLRAQRALIEIQRLTGNSFQQVAAAAEKSQ